MARFVTNELINHQTFIKVITFKCVCVCVFASVLSACIYLYHVHATDAKNGIGTMEMKLQMGVS